MSDRRYRAAIIGCGKMARGHAQALVESTQVDLVAGADVSEAARERIQRDFGIPSMYSSPIEMLETERPDLVSICTWPPLHAELTELAFRNGVKGVWCEKPMAVHLSEADRMLHAATAAEGVLVINHQRRYVRAYLQGRDLIREGTIGEVTQITGICAGDALTDGTHLIDMTRYLNNDIPVTSVFGGIDMTPKGDVSPDGMGTIEFNRTRMRYGHHVESGAMAILFFENGVRGYLEMGNLAREGYQRFIIDGTEGRIELSGDRPFADGSRARVRRRAGSMEALPETNLEHAMDDVLSDMLAAIESGCEHRLSGESGRQDLEIVNAIYESARRRMIVALPLEVHESPLEAMLTSGEIPIN